MVSNDGNTSRAFFRNYSTTAEITGIPEELIRRFDKILNILACSRFINPEELRKLTSETAILLRNTFPDRNFTPTVHKVLYHSADLVAYFNIIRIPIGWFSEEPLEARNKDIRNFRDRYARKSSYKNNLTDVVRLLTVSSDPYFNQFRRNLKNKPTTYSSEMVDLFAIEPVVLMDLDNY